MPLGVPELLIILAIMLVVFGPKRLPELGRQLGGGLKGFKDSVTGDDDDEDEAPALTRAAAPEDVPTPVAAPASVEVHAEPADRPRSPSA